MPKTDAAPDLHEFASAEEALGVLAPVLRRLSGPGAGALLGATGKPVEIKDAVVYASFHDPTRMMAARAWLTRLGEYGLERIGMMTRREVLERFAEATVIADAEPENDAWGGVAMGYAAVLTGELPVEGMPGALAHELTLAMNADRDAQEARPCART